MPAPAAADRVERAGKKLARVSVRRPLEAGLYVQAETIMQAADGAARAIAPSATSTSRMRSRMHTRSGTARSMLTAGLMATWPVRPPA